MRFLSPFQHSPRAAAMAAPVMAAVVALSLAACGGGQSDAAKGQKSAGDLTACRTLDTARVVSLAVRQFITTADPKPLRFLYMAGTDSMLPEAGTRVLQDKGPTYLWPSDLSKAAPVRKKLGDAGPWNALLVTYKGVSQPTPETARVRIGGTWVGPVDDGKQLGVKAASFECRAEGDSANMWRLTGIAPEQGA